MNGTRSSRRRTRGRTKGRSHVAPTATEPRAPLPRPGTMSAQPLALTADSIASASAAGLRYVTDQQPGFRRMATRRGFRYVDAEGRAVRNGAVLDRIRRLAIPPAWRDVWIAPSAEAHLQATGRDARGRKQYRYHARWRATRDMTKYGRLLAFAHSLRGIRRRTTSIWAGRDCPGKGARRGRATPRENVDPRRQRRIRANEQIVWSDDPARSPCRHRRR